MGKSPGKWIKTVLFGKKSSKSSLSKDATSEIKTSITGKAPPREIDADAMVISSPVRPVLDSSAEHTELELEKSSSASLMPDTAEHITSPIESNAADGEELIKLEQAATKAQAAFRGYLARRAFWALKGIIRLQALVRGHLVRRQAVATLRCMRAIVEFQALARGRRVRLSGDGQVHQKYTSGQVVIKKPSELLATSLREEKLSTNVFATKLVASSHATMPLSFQYDPVEPNSARSWLVRWSSTSFWEPVRKPKKALDAKPKRKPTKLQAEETETVKPKRSVRRVPAANSDNSLSNSSENEKSRRTVRKIPTHQPEPVQEQSLNELEKVKRNLRKISLSASLAPEKSDIMSEIKPEIKPETDAEKPLDGLNKVSSSPSPAPEFSEQKTDRSLEEVNGSNVESVKQPEPEEAPLIQPVEDDKPLDVLQQDDNPPPIEPLSPETNGKLENEPLATVELNGKEDHGSKENQKTRRRKSLATKQEHNESVSQNSPTLPSYMAATESAKAKLRAQAAAKAAEEGAENGFSRRHSLPSSTGKPSLQSPRVQKPNSKGGSKPNKSQVSPKDEKMVQTGWRR
ncbi:hypothetical protein OSB04_027070 [Centaurea solstitialis]|uniref:DUF4005 domain-containing protein n=1 Tax=Centaurea solstitialis TaxID=347529 RepID=A0AA38SEJ0_9ASTR|nr:hypothetical protein OSB04_027070 [Centaurea solstitialis]